MAQWLQPVRIETAVGGFELERSLGWFAGVVDWCGREVMVQLEIDTDAAEGAETCAVALARLQHDYADAAAIDARWRAFAAAKLTDLANEWREQEHDDDGAAPTPITTEGFAQRIHLSELSVAADGAVTPYYDDDRMFWGHVILLDVESDGSMTDAYIAG